MTIAVLAVIAVAVIALTYWYFARNAED